VTILVGTAGWSYPDWEGRVYPPRPGRARDFHPLRHLARFLDCVELNGTFYGEPRAEHAERWVELVDEHPAFRFTAKLHRSFTHEPLPRSEDELGVRLQAFLAGLEPLRASGRLRALLVQFPLSFRRGDPARSRLERLAPRLRGWTPVLEVRHRSWFGPDAYAELERLGYGLARIDLPDAAEHPPADAPSLGPVGYVRLHGRNAATWFDPRAGRDGRYDYLYPASEVAEIVRLTRRLAEGKDETYVITNNHFSGKAVANALEILAELREEPPLAPGELVRAFPRLEGVVRIAGGPSAGQGTLFG